MMKAPPLPRSARQPQRKMFLAFRICAPPIFLKKERTFFFGVLPSKYSGSVAGLQCGLGFAKTIFWGKGFRKTSALLPPAERGLGNECGRVFPFRIFMRWLCENEPKGDKMVLNMESREPKLENAVESKERFGRNVEIHAIFTRHAEKDEAGNLTPNGKEHARIAGESLEKRDAIKADVAPVQRVID